MEYAEGHVRRNTVTGAVAVRSIFDPSMFPELVWLIATTGSGAKNGTQSDVDGADWVDLYTPPGA